MDNLGLHKALPLIYPFTLFFSPLMFWQNDLVHAWGLDFQLGYCVQAISTSFNYIPIFQFFDIQEDMSYVQSIL